MSKIILSLLFSYNKKFKNYYQEYKLLKINLYVKNIKYIFFTSFDIYKLNQLIFNFSSLSL